jgi:glycosyltransferase involved in cell wall biosynthesis
VTTPAPLRFCMLTTFYPPWSFGGDGIHVQRLSQALAARGHDVTVVHSMEAFRTLTRTQPASGAEPGVRVIPIDAGLGALSPLATYLTGRPLLTRRQIARVLDSEFDVLHFHNPSLLGGPALLAMGSAVKLYTIHEQWLLCPTHVLWKYQRRPCDKRDCVRCTLSYRRPPQPWRYTRLLARSLPEVDVAVAPSRATLELHAPLRPYLRMAHLRPFVPDVTGADDPPYRHPRPYFLYVGRLESFKGVDSLVAAFRRPQPADLIIAGSGTLEHRLRRECADLPCVHLLGWRGQPEMGGLYRGALAVLVPTRGHENFPQVVLEAFSRGTPAVVRGFGALREVAEDSGGALTYRTEAELDAALARLAADPGLRADLGSRGQHAFRAQWTERAFMGHYLTLITEAAQRRGRSALAASAMEWARQEGAQCPDER